MSDSIAGNQFDFDLIKLDWSGEEKNYPTCLGIYKEPLFYRNIKLVSPPSIDKIYSLVWRDGFLQAVYSKREEVKTRWKPCPICNRQIDNRHVLHVNGECWILCDCKLSSPTFSTKEALFEYWNQSRCQD